MSHAILTVDLGFGDAGKGSIVDFLTRHHDVHTVIRYNGGAQAGHRVVTADGREHVFSQFGSGTLAGADTYLSRFVLLDPLAMEAEEAHLRALGIGDAFARTAIDERALVVTPYQRAVNRLRELARGDNRHGSCGMGIGETMRDTLHHGDDVLFAADLRHPDRLRRKLAFLRQRNVEKLAAFVADLPDCEQVAAERTILDDPSWLDWLMEDYGDFAQRAQIVPGRVLRDVLQRPGAVIFEGAQGVLLDEWRGFHPHTTWSTTTLANADRLLREADHAGEVTRLGITRAYATRHGAGPLPTEDALLAQALPDACNGEGPWQGSFRVGWLDGVLLRYAVDVVGRLDGLAVTCLDRVAALPELRFCRRYDAPCGRVEQLPTSPTPCDLDFQAHLTGLLQACTPVYEWFCSESALLANLESTLGIPVTLISRGDTALDKELVSMAASPARHVPVG